MPPVGAWHTPTSLFEKRNLSAHYVRKKRPIKMSDGFKLNRLIYFAAVVDAGSFTRAAERLGVGKTIVSQQIARLEQELGTSLLARTTRRVQATEAGRQLYARCATILREADAAVAEMSDINSEPRGVLRITAPSDFGAFVLAPLATTFCDLYPAVSVELVLCDTRLDLIAQDIDLAIRVGWLEDSSLQARRVGTFEQLPVATGKLARSLPDLHPKDLASLPFIANTSMKDPVQWTFVDAADASQHCAVRLSPRLKVNSTPAALSATLAGGGFSILPDFLIEKEIADNTLIPLLPRWSLPSGGVYLVYPASRYRPSKVTAFAELLIEQAKRHCRHH